jgi:DNA-binding MarR family transcriptional regulator
LQTQKWEDYFTGVKEYFEYLSYIVFYTKINGRPPADMQQYFKVTPPTVHQMVVRLEGLGLIKRVPGVGRSIQVLIPLDKIPALK